MATKGELIQKSSFQFLEIRNRLDFIEDARGEEEGAGLRRSYKMHFRLYEKHLAVNERMAFKFFFPLKIIRDCRIKTHERVVHMA